jgi:hypothetical protein
MTPRDIIQLALRDAGVTGEGIIPSADDVSDAFTKLNWMLAQWQRKRWLIWHLIDLAYVADGQPSFTVGPGGALSTLVRPDKIESAFVRQLVGNSSNSYVDYPLTLIPSYESYSVIALKKLPSFPQYLFYDSGYPLGSAYPWPVPQAGLYETHLQVKELLNQFTSLDQTIVLPEEYFPAIELNLVIRIAPGYGRQPDPAIVALAKDSLNVLRMANTQISTLRMPGELVRNGIYNPYSDQIR